MFRFNISCDSVHPDTHTDITIIQLAARTVNDTKALLLTSTLYRELHTNAVTPGNKACVWSARVTWERGYGTDVTPGDLCMNAGRKK